MAVEEEGKARIDARRVAGVPGRRRVSAPADGSFRASVRQLLDVIC
jgi:hypothetical protein